VSRCLRDFPASVRSHAASLDDIVENVLMRKKCGFLEDYGGLEPSEFSERPGVHPGDVHAIDNDFAHRGLNQSVNMSDKDRFHDHNSRHSGGPVSAA